MNREHEVLNAFAEALREAQITGLAFIRVNANGHVQALPSDRVRISVIQAVEERTAATPDPRNAITSGSSTLVSRSSGNASGAAVWRTFTNDRVRIPG